MEEKTESKVNIDIETEFVEVACERCGEKFFAVRGARERMLSGSGQIICPACQREEELLDSIAMKKEEQAKDAAVGASRADVMVWVAIMGMLLFLGMKIWILWPEGLRPLKPIPMIVLLGMAAIMISQLRGIARGERPLWRRRGK